MEKYINLSKILKIIVPALALLIMTSSCAVIDQPQAAEEAQPDRAEEAEVVEYIRINASEAKELIDTREVIIVDVRTLAEFEEIRIDGSILIPDYEIAELAPEMLSDKDALILIYCRSGRRSELAARILIDMGYTDVYDFGGIIDWPFETISGD